VDNGRSAYLTKLKKQTLISVENISKKYKILKISTLLRKATPRFDSQRTRMNCLVTYIIISTSGCPWPSDTVKSPGSPSMSWKSCAKIEIPHPENHILKVFRFRSWKPRVWKSRPQSWDPKSWKPYPKISQVFLGLGNPECKLQVSKNWGSHVLKIMSKFFSGLSLGNSHRVRPKTEISRLENHVLKNSMSKFWWTPNASKLQVAKNWDIKNSTRNGQWLEESSKHCLHRQTLLL
jgi:hypothetical protein